MNTFSYKTIQGPFGVADLAVYMDGKKIGLIRKLMDGYTYLPGGRIKFRGTSFPTIRECQKSIEDV